MPEAYSHLKVVCLSNTYSPARDLAAFLSRHAEALRKVSFIKSGVKDFPNAILGMFNNSPRHECETWMAVVSVLRKMNLEMLRMEELTSAHKNCEILIGFFAGRYNRQRSICALWTGPQVTRGLDVLIARACQTITRGNGYWADSHPFERTSPTGREHYYLNLRSANLEADPQHMRYTKGELDWIRRAEQEEMHNKEWKERYRDRKEKTVKNRSGSPSPTLRLSRTRSGPPPTRSTLLAHRRNSSGSTTPFSSAVAAKPTHFSRLQPRRTPFPGTVPHAPHQRKDQTKSDKLAPDMPRFVLAKRGNFEGPDTRKYKKFSISTPKSNLPKHTIHQQNNSESTRSISNNRTPAPGSNPTSLAQQATRPTQTSTASRDRVITVSRTTRLARVPKANPNGLENCDCRAGIETDPYLAEVMRPITWAPKKPNVPHGYFARIVGAELNADLEAEFEHGAEHGAE